MVESAEQTAGKKGAEVAASGNKKYIDDKTSQEFEHKPAGNLADVKQQKEFKRKLEEQREKRRLMERVTKTIADEVDDSEVAADVWLQKLKEKQEAAKKEKLLQEMDNMLEEQANESNRKAKNSSSSSRAKYTASNLKGMRIEHDELMFQEERELILTLKDRRILKGMSNFLFFQFSPPF
jgi:hypothetical protein